MPMKLRLVLASIVTLAAATAAGAQEQPPSALYGPLFTDVQMQRVFPDGKGFVDMVPHEAPAAVLQRYRDERGRPGFDLGAFVRENFSVERPPATDYRSDAREDVCTHIDKLWSV